MGITDWHFISSWRSRSTLDTVAALILGSVAILILSTLGDTLYNKMRQNAAFRSAQRTHGCQKVPRYPHRGFLGLDLMKDRQEAADQGRSMAHYDDWFAKLGHTWEEEIGGQRLINTIDMMNIRFIFNADMNTLGRAGAFHKNDFLGPGIFSSDGPRWKWSRDIIKPLFKKTEAQSTVMFKNHVDRFIAHIPQDSSTVDVQPLLKKMNFDSAAEFIFGKSTDSLLPGSPYSDGEFIEAFNYANAGSLKRRKAGRLAFRYWLDRVYGRTVAEVHAFVDQQVRHALNRSPASEEDGIKGYVLINELAQRIRDPITLRYECLNIFAGGRDGVAVLTANALFCLARNPHLWLELRTTALTIPEGAALNLDAESLRPFRNVIYETIRSTGPSATVTRTAFKDTVLPRGGGPGGDSPVYMHAGDQVSMFGWGCNHIESVWGKDCYNFDPSRWSHINIPSEFVPFGGGRRICPAYQQVYVQTAYILIRLTKEFASIDNRDPVLEYVELDRNLTESRNGVQIGLTKSPRVAS